MGGGRTLSNGQSDPLDPEVVARGAVTATIGGTSGSAGAPAGVVRLTGEFPRLYVLDLAKPKWQNVEITWYGSVNGIAGARSWHGMDAATRSEHHNTETPATQCNARTYYARSLFVSGVLTL